MLQETRECQNCKQSFVIDQGDFDFYKKMDVPPPTFCPVCRMQRRYAWRNERTLSKAVCGSCQKKIFSMYPSRAGLTVFCRECHLSDKWDPLSYGREYDFSRPFFDQYQDLFKAIPHLNLWHLNSVNSPFANATKDAKNVYLSFSIVGSEDVAYCKNVDKSQEIYDSLNLTECEYCYWGMFGTLNYEVHYSMFTRSCLNSAFLLDCVNSKYCFMSANLRNREYVFYGKQLTKAQYDTEMAKINTGSYQVFTGLVSDFKKLYTNSLHKYANVIKSVNTTGHVLTNMKNAKQCFEASDCEDVRYVGRVFTLNDCMDTNNLANAELVYEYANGGNAERNLKLSTGSNGALSDCTYTASCKSSSNLFGCVGVRDKKYCILNKQYTKEEYEAMIPRVIKHMNEMPYQGKNGRVYKYGEFFPIELSPFGYNESVAQEHVTLSREEITRFGYEYVEPEVKSPKIDVVPAQLPDDSAQTPDDIVQKTISCEHASACIHQCTGGFRLTPQELVFYKRFKLPLPRQCPNCRHHDRLSWRNPWKLWQGKCQCAGMTDNEQLTTNNGYKNLTKHFHGEEHCQEKFETSYASGRLETLYCEQCYNSEIV